MRLRRAARRHFAMAVARAPFREPPRGEPEAAGHVWVLASAAALALMVFLPGVLGRGAGSLALGGKIARALESGAVQELAAAAADSLARSPFLSPVRSHGGAS
jgi:hypothetical protein